MTQQGYPPGPPMTGYPGLPGIPNQQPAPAQQPQAPQGYPPPQQPAPGYPPQAPPYPGQVPQQPAPGYPPPQAPQGYPGAGYPPPQAAPTQGYGSPYAQPGAPPQGMPMGNHVPGRAVAGGFQQPRNRRTFTGADMQGLSPAGSRHPFMNCIDAARSSNWILEVMKTEQAEMSGSFVVEFKVLWTDLPGVVPGDMRSWVQTFDKGPQGFEMGLRAVKRFVLSALGVDTEEEAMGQGHPLDELYSAVADSTRHLTHPQTGQPLRYGPNPLKGRTIACCVNPPKPGFNRMNQPNVFQLHNFSPYRGSPR